MFQEYKIDYMMHKSKNSLIYKVFLQNKKAVIKLLQKENPSREDIAKFNLEYNLCKKFDGKGICEMYDTIEHEGQYGFVMEYLEGTSLNKLILNNRLERKEVLEIAIQVIDIIGRIHEKGIVHKDINPSNVIWNRELKKATIIDFGIASILENEVQHETMLSQLEGTLPYISPEQTGRMNRSLDYRADYYSFGVTLYELLAGKKPFITDDIMEMIHHHIATNPRPINEIEDVPKVLSDIVRKLMSKNPEDRYQSSFGIKKDLEKCLDMITLDNLITDFEIGKKDTNEKFSLAQKIFGREEEVKLVLEGFEKVTDNNFSQILFVSGESGIGKTSIINEVYKPLIKNRAYFIKGKYEAFSRNIPYLGIKFAMKNLINQILSESDYKIEIWKSRILNAVGDLASVITSIVPELELLIGKQGKLPKLDPTNEQNRFKAVFQKFFQALGSKDNPIVLFLDDIQWIDMPSLEIMKAVLLNEETKNMFFIGAYRNTEVDETHILSNLIKNVGV